MFCKINLKWYLGDGWVRGHEKARPPDKGGQGGCRGEALPDLVAFGETGLDPGDLHLLDVPDGDGSQQLDAVLIFHSVFETDAGGGGTDGLDDGLLQRHGPVGGFGGFGGGLCHGGTFGLGCGFGYGESMAYEGGRCQDFLRYFLRLGWNQAAMEEACQG